MNLITNSNKKYFPRSLIKTSDTEGRDAFQPLAQDWSWMNPAFFTRVSANRLDFDTIGAQVQIGDRFQVGDRIRILQSGSVKYFAVYSVSDTSIYITAGTTYTLTTSAIDEIFLSRIDNPLGFPTFFNYTSSITSPGVTLTIGSGSYKFSLKGGLIVLDFHISNSSLSGGPTSSIFGTLPVPADSDWINNSPLYPSIVVSDFQLQTGMIKLGSPNNSSIEMQIVEFPGAGGTGFGLWDNTTSGWAVDFTISYLI